MQLVFFFFSLSLKLQALMMLFWKRNFSLENSWRCKSAARTETWLPKRLRNLSLARGRRVIIHGEKRDQCCQDMSYPIENTWSGNSPVVRWLGLCAFTAESPGPVPGKRQHLIYWKIAQSFQDLWKASKHCEKNQCNTSPLLFFHFSFWFFPPTTFSLR